MSTPLLNYQKRIGEFSSGVDQLGKPLRRMPWLRLLLFITTGFSIFYAVKFPGALFVAVSVLAFTGFLFAGWYDNRLKMKLLHLKKRIRINTQEIEVLHGNYATLDPGNEFVNEDHPYTHDLDIFGIGSLFQYINRTSTIFGKERLADYFNNAFQYRDEILERQKAIEELAANIEFRQRLQLIFLDQETSRRDLAALSGWLNGNEGILWIKPLKFVSFFLPVLTLCSMIFSGAGILPYQLPVIMVIVQLLIVFGYGRKTLSVHQQVTSQVDILGKYALVS